MSETNAEDNVVQRPSETFLSRKLLTKHVQKLHLQPGDVLAVKAGSAVAKQEILQGIADAMGRLGLKDIILIVVDDFKDLSVLNQTEMNRHGWYHVPQLKKLVHLPKDAEKEKPDERPS